MIVALLNDLLTTGVCALVPATSDLSCNVECGCFPRFLLLVICALTCRGPLLSTEVSRDRFLLLATFEVAGITGLPLPSLVGCTRSSPPADDSLSSPAAKELFYASLSFFSCLAEAMAAASLFSLCLCPNCFLLDGSSFPAAEAPRGELDAADSS